MDTILAIFVGIGLASACGFRVFVPILILAVAQRAGYVSLGEGWEWIGSYPAIIALCAATLLEAGAYLVPWLDNALDVIASPTAVVAGALLAASQFTNAEALAEWGPIAQWAGALIAGGGSALTVQASTVAVRAGSTASTAGAANPGFSITETLAAVGLSILAIVWPIAAAALLLVVFALAFFLIARYIRRRRSRRSDAARLTTTPHEAPHPPKGDFTKAPKSTRTR